MNAVLALLPDSWKPYAKAVVAFAGAFLVLAAQLLPLLPDGAATVVTSVVAVLTALGVERTPNVDPYAEDFDG